MERKEVMHSMILSLLEHNKNQTLFNGKCKRLSYKKIRKEATKMTNQIMGHNKPPRSRKAKNMV